MEQRDFLLTEQLEQRRKAVLELKRELYDLGLFFSTIVKKTPINFNKYIEADCLIDLLLKDLNIDEQKFQDLSGIVKTVVEILNREKQMAMLYSSQDAEQSKIN